MPKRGEGDLQMVDRLFEPGDVVVAEHRFFNPRGDSVTRVGELGAEREQIALNREEQVGDFGRDAQRACDAQPRIQLVDFTVRIHARVRLRDARAIKQPRLTRIARLGVDAHGGL